MIKNFFKFIFKLLKWIFLVGILIIFFILSLIVFQGRIYIELVVIFILLFGFLSWRIWFKSSQKKLLKNYNPENDKGRKAEEEKEFIRRTPGTRRGIGKAESKSATSIASNVRPEQSSGRGILPSAKADANGKNSSGRRKTSKSPRGFFARRKRRK